jgi:hypothetical protein
MLLLLLLLLLLLQVALLGASLNLACAMIVQRAATVWVGYTAKHVLCHVKG